ncbi:Zn-dependent protease with chaperone function [Paenibacillus cellulosilyticus]|uniref:Zn-dependent protease with chaperone function n=1 Tax=Paenibacillus cellulosilyticus TaxID=375489 RepID=A0A2V2Z4F0_9BACL|nr:M56 family metallopeptidase [Paenibacillus cellulosilyticus]PWW08680.1 Zn-dependent protease with chaperone function [Paenibacillus cellulosilyticus]QKS48246.1 M56 family metallopeptidase [Paenibacillus cellulosilyticus]
MNAPAKLRWIYALAIFFIVMVGVQLAIYTNHSIHSNSAQCLLVAYIELGLLAGYTIVRVIWRVSAQAYLSYKWGKHFRFIRHEKLTKRLRYKYRDLGVPMLVVRDDAFVAMAIGMRKPTIVISDTVMDMFSEEELKAIILHEWHHCRNRDNAKLFFTKLLTESFGYLPIMRPIYRYYHTWMELLADRFAIERMGTELPLASVLLRLSKLGNRRQHAAAVHFASATMQYRIAQVLEPDQAVKVKVAIVRPMLISLSLLTLLMISGDS